jgi:hypothetical protein
VIPIWTGRILKQGYLKLDRPKDYLRYVRSLGGEFVELQIRKRKSRRSSRSNSFYWAAIIPAIAEASGMTNDETHTGLLGYDDTGYILPPLSIEDQVIRASRPPDGMLFHDMAAKGIQGRMAARCASLEDRVAATARLVRGRDQWIVWCGLNTESAALARAIPGAVEVTGADTYAEKRGAVEGFLRGEIRVLVSKIRILGFGLNLQHCHRMVFVGIGDSYEQYYQAIRRCWRFGQQHPVDVHIVVSEAETGVVANVRRKEEAASALSRELLSEMHDFEREELCA